MPRANLSQGDIITPIPYPGPLKPMYKVVEMSLDTTDFWVEQIEPPVDPEEPIERIKWGAGNFRIVKKYQKPGVPIDENGDPLQEGQIDAGV